ncbi:MAG: MoaD/ThiS family protein [Actinomycetota bacterium]
MRVRLRNPDREVEMAGARTVREMLGELDLSPDTVLVIRAGELVTRDVVLDEGDDVEIRPVISGGQVPRGGRR